MARTILLQADKQLLFNDRSVSPGISYLINVKRKVDA